MHAILVYCSGGSLHRHLQTRGHGVGIGEPACAAVLAQVGSALAHMHELGVTHRDVKPGNVVFDDLTRASARIVDFGFAQLHKLPSGEGAHRTRKLKTVCGTPCYMAPELNAGRPYSGPPVDVWALGCLAYEMLHNRLAFRAQSIQELNVRILKAKHDAFCSTISKHMRSIMTRALTVDVAERATAIAIVDLLRDGKYGAAARDTQRSENQELG